LYGWKTPFKPANDVCLHDYSWTDIPGMLVMHSNIMTARNSILLIKTMLETAQEDTTVKFIAPNRAGLFPFPCTSLALVG